MKGEWEPNENLRLEKGEFEPSEKDDFKEDKKSEFVEEFSIDHRVSDNYLFTKDLEEIVKDIEKAEELHAIYSEDILISSSDTEAVKEYFEELMKGEGVMITNDLEFESSKSAELEKRADHINENQEESKEIDSEKVKEMDNSESKESPIEINAKKMHLAKDIKFEAKSSEPAERIQENQSHENNVSKEIDQDRELIYKASSRQAAVQTLKQETKEVSQEEAHRIKEEKYKETEDNRVNKSHVHTQYEEKRAIKEKKEEKANSINEKAKSKDISAKKEESSKNFNNDPENHENIQELQNKETILKEEWEHKLLDWIQESKDKKLIPKKKKELIESIKQYRIARNDYAQMRDLYLKCEKREPSEKDKQIIKELSQRFKEREAKEIEMFKELHRFRRFYEYNKKLWYDSVIESKKEIVPRLLTEKLEKLHQLDKVNKQAPKNHLSKDSQLSLADADIEQLKKRYNQETGKRAIYAGKETIDFKEWKKSLNEVKNVKYSALQLIEDLRKELQNYPELLAQIFPERIRRYTDRDLSRIWRGSNFHYINRIKDKIKNVHADDYKPNFRFSDKVGNLKLLEERLIQKYGVKVIGCLKIIELYNESNSSITTLEFIERIEKELGRISSEIEVTGEELSLILGDFDTFIRNTLDTINNKNSKRWYNPDYKFTRERLDDFKEIFSELLGYQAGRCLHYIEKYEKLNPDLKYFHSKDYSIKNVEYFHIIDNVEKAYWLGFLYADGHLSSNRPRISLELSLKDIDRIERFINVIGLDIDRIERYQRTMIYKRKIRPFATARIRFSSKKIALDLRNNGFQKFKNRKEGLPDFIKFKILEAKIEASNTGKHWSKTNSGKIALAFLLGFYDGDGTYITGKNAKIYSSNKTFLDQIKMFYDIKNNVNIQSKANQDILEELPIRERKEGGSMYYLTIGPNIFDAMINSFSDSLKRKRPKKSY